MSESAAVPGLLVTKLLPACTSKLVRQNLRKGTWCDPASGLSMGLVAGGNSVR
jgi:hypothetical protein